MLTKSSVLESLETLPEQATIKDIIEYLQSLDDLEAAIEAMQNGTARPHVVVMEEARAWIKAKQWPQS